jgi:copper transport protein
MPAIARVRLVAASRFGDLLGLRYGVLLILVAVAFVTWSPESASAPSPGRRGPLVLMGLLGVAALTLLADQGHASQAPLAPLSVTADATHLTAAAIWVGLPCLAVVLRRAPAALAGATLRRFSRIALVSVAAIAITGLARLAGDLSSPAQLLTTGYGRDVMLKISPLTPILVVAQRNRRAVAALADGGPPSAARLRSIAPQCPHRAHHRPRRHHRRRRPRRPTPRPQLTSRTSARAQPAARCAHRR